MKGFAILPVAAEGGFSYRGPFTPVTEDALVAPEVLVQEEDVEIMKLVRPALDTLWQGSGHAGSHGYDETGSWVGYSRYLR